MTNIVVSALFIVATFVGQSKSEDVCYQPFSQFLQCMVVEANTKFATYEKEASAESQERIRTCFTSSSCEAPDFSQATIEYFVTEPWATRIRTCLDLLESTDPRVQACMVDYFKGMAERKIEQCVRTYGPPDVKNFEMPPIPELKNLDISRLKAATLDRMMVWKQLMQCSRTNANDVQLQSTIDCVKGIRNGNAQTMCQARETCRQTKISDFVCLDRFDKVNKAACDCVKAESQQKMSGLDNWKELKDSLFQGGMERQYKKCHSNNNLPYPKARVDAAKKAIGDSIRDVLFKGGIPPEVKETLDSASAALKDIMNEWKKMFCSDCAASTPSASTNDAQVIRDYVVKHDQQLQQQAMNPQPSNNFMDRLRAMFGGGSANQQQNMQMPL